MQSEGATAGFTFCKCSRNHISPAPPPTTTAYDLCLCPVQDVVPDFFGDGYYKTVRNALKRVDGMGLPDHLAGRVCDVLFQEVFANELEPRSEDMVDLVKEYMQSILKNLFEEACQAYPTLLNEIKTNLVEEFMEAKKLQAVEAVSNVVKAEMGWMFTQNRAYTATIKDVCDMVGKTRKSELASEAASDVGNSYEPEEAGAVGDVPKEFIKKMVASKEVKDQGIRKLQVRALHYAFHGSISL